MVDNLSIIKPLLNFESEDDFYYLQLLQRKKENPQLGSNSRVIKNYYIRSLDYLEERYDEIKSLCDEFNARAMLRLNKRSYRKVAFRTMVNVANTIANGEYQFIGKCYDRACGETHNAGSNKTWILDFDNVNPDFVSEPSFIYWLSKFEPIGNKYLATIPSLTGYHMIVKPFDSKEFKRDFPHIDIHKDNPTNLYIP